MISIKKGFTLIELLVVIAIIGILATLVVTQVIGAQVKARNSTATNDVTVMGRSVEMMKTNLGDGLNVVGNANSRAVAATQVNATTVGNIPGTYLYRTTAGADTVAGGFTTLFSGTESTTSYGASITKTPGQSYIYGFAASNVAVVAPATTSSGTSYCIGSTVPSGYTAVVFTGGSTKNAVGPTIGGNVVGNYVNYGAVATPWDGTCN